MAAPATSMQDQYKVNVKVCYPFVNALTSALKTMCNMNVTMGKPAFKDRATDDKPNLSIQAAIATQDTLAQVSITMTYKFFFILMGRMLGEVYTALTPEIEDGAKELMNVVFNQAKKPLSEKGLAAVRSIPSIIFGENLSLSYLTRGQTIVIPMESEFGHFSIEITTQDITESDKVSGG